MQVGTLRTTVNGVSSARTYGYDENGNIISVSDGTNTTTYVYDSANQLLRENNQAAGKTWVWTYDNGGNILSKTEYAYTTGGLDTPVDTVQYGYSTGGWGDLLTSHDGNAITSDEIGNMLTYGDEKTFTWKHGRELSQMTDDSGTWSFEYNADGLRVYRTNGTATYKYYYNGDKLTRMAVDYADPNAADQELTFGYDANGAPQYVIYGGHRYFYLTNLQGDVTSIITVGGTTVVEYTYDAWGNILTVTGGMANTLGKANPLRYRGYVYDDETRLYYLQSRYYDPQIGRFINSDVYTSTGQGLLGNNMFAYCGNDPVNKTDGQGTSWTLAICGAVFNVATTYIAAKATGQNYTFGDGIAAALAGGLGTAKWWLGGLIAGVYTGVTAVKNGASATEAISCGVIAGITTVLSVGNITKWTTHIDLGQTAKLINVASDFIFGIGSNSISAATYKATVSKPASNRQPTHATPRENISGGGRVRTSNYMLIK